MSDPTVDLHALANAPYAGTAATALAEAGLRLHVEVPPDYELFRIEVGVSVMLTTTVPIIVAAEDQKAAMEKALEGIAVEDVISPDQLETEVNPRHVRKVSPQEALQMIRTEHLRLEIDE